VKIASFVSTVISLRIAQNAVNVANATAVLTANTAIHVKTAHIA
jgi:hypothetical protein